MADAIVCATIQILLEKALSLATNRIGLAFGFKDELENLRESMVMTQALLADADSRQSHDKAVKLWLRRLEGVAFDADQALDELHYETLRHQVVTYRNRQLKVCFFFSFSYTKFAFHWRMASKVRDINMKLKKINQEAHDFGLNTRHQIDAALPPTAPRITISRQTDSIVPPDPVGRTHDVSEMVKILLSPSEETVLVTPIIGMPGVGKTTLAKLIYNHPQVVKHFEKKCWVCVSEKFDGIELFKLILESLKREVILMSGRDAIVQEIRRELEGKICLLVLDDVWNENQTLWDDFFNSLVGLIPTNGSRCIVTTRSGQVASIVSRHSPYHLKKLSDDDCWSILTRKPSKNGEIPQELIVMKQQILKRCGGLPLAASVVGGLLCIKREDEWVSIVEKNLLTVKEDGNSVQQILKLSFDNLPGPSIKKCFAYCSVFPKDHIFHKDVLIQFWMAEGFLQSYHNNQPTMEDIGDQYIRILLQASLLEGVEHPLHTCYKMHDLVHDLAETILSPSKLENGEIENRNEVRYLSLNASNGMTEKIVEGMSVFVRTLFLKGKSFDMLPKFKNLYVLNLEGANIVELPTSIGKLIHLRLLFASRKMRTLPESVCKLYCMQTLRIQHLRDFPKGLSNLINLRHIYFDEYRRYQRDIQMPLKMGRLTCLQTLKFFNIGEEIGRKIQEIQHLKDLKGELVIRNLELVNGKEVAKGANLFEKPNLLKLEFEWNRRNREGVNCDEDTLEGLEPHSNLQELKISNFLGNKFPQWFMNLSKLVKLEIEGCQRCSELPAIKQLPSLKHLSLRGLDSIQFVGGEFYGITNEEEGGRLQGPRSSTRRRKFFPAYEKIEVRCMKNLVEWKDATISEAELYVFPMLRYFTIHNCPQVTTLPCLAKILEVMVCPNLASIRIVNGTSLEGLTLITCENLKELPKDLFGLSLRYLNIQHCPRLISLGVNGQNCSLPCLEQLHIECCHELTTIPGKMFESCPSLRCLWVEDCLNLDSFSLNLKETPSLEEFHLVGCPKLNPHSFKGFAFATCLRKLRIGPFSSNDSSIDDFDWSGLISASTLRELGLRGLPHTDSLPHQLQYLTSLTTLGLRNFGGIEVLPDWIGDLVSLEELWLWTCEKLRSLPSEDAMRRLTKLTMVPVYWCPLLRQRYTPQRGIFLEEEISSYLASNDRAPTSGSYCFPSLLKKKSSRES